MISIDKSQENLKEWTLEYIKNKDIVLKKIEKIEDLGETLFIIYKDKKQLFLILSFFRSIEDLFEKIKNAKLNFDFDVLSLVVYNTEKNFFFMLANWNKLIAYPKLNLIFANKFSQLDKKWIISPHTHAKISDPDSLEQGLKTMFQTVEPISDDELKEMFS